MTDYPTREYIVRETTYPDATKQEAIGELVRCKDCKSFSHGYCRFHEAKFVNPKAYCFWGERKDGDHG